MANHAHSTRTPLLPQAGASSALLARGADRQLGPVTLALRVMQAGIPETERERVRALRRAIGDRIEADLALLDMLAGDADLEPALSAVEPYSWQGQETWAAGSRDDRETVECFDCDGELVHHTPIALSRFA